MLFKFLIVMAAAALCPVASETGVSRSHLFTGDSAIKAEQQSLLKRRIRSKKKSKKQSCKTPMANLAVVNFTSAKILVYINGKKSGNAPAEDQKLLKEVLPVGTVLVQLTMSDKTPLMEQEYTIVAAGKKTCKNTQSIILR